MASTTAFDEFAEVETIDVQVSEAPDAIAVFGTPGTLGLVLDHTQFDVTKHDGMVTIQNPATGNHRTFRIRTQDTDAKFAPGRRIVSLLIGPDRSSHGDWKGFAWADDFGVHTWMRLKGSEFETYGRMLESPSKFASKGAKYMAEIACRKCGKPLTRPDSIASGLGPICREQI